MPDKNRELVVDRWGLVRKGALTSQTSFGKKIFMRKIF